MVFPNSEVGVASQSTLFGVENDEICDYNTISGGIDNDLRQAGYETVWLLIPACSLSAPHRRDRVWIVANCQSARQLRKEQLENSSQGKSGRGTDRAGNRTSTDRINKEGEEGDKRQNEQPQFGDSGQDSDVANPNNEGLQGSEQQGTYGKGYGPRKSHEPTPKCDKDDTNSETKGLARAITEGQISGGRSTEYNSIPGWEENWYEVATRVCTMDDGVSNGLVRPKGWRVSALKAAGNAIVPQVAYQLIKNIVEIDAMAEQWG
jgi:DNA (cytosine-5)-methyltransferase 1